MFWLGLNNQRKSKLLNLAEIFFSKLNPTQLKIIFENKIQYENYNIDYFNPSCKNVIIIKTDEDLHNMVINIEEKQKKSLINTIIFNHIDLSEYDLINIPSQIKNIQFNFTKLKSIDNIHDGIEVIDCNQNYIRNIDNLPKSVKILICSNNEISSLDNLPEDLEYLDCHTNKINKLVNLPKSLKYLKCNYNKIESIYNLPCELIKLDCSKNLLDKLPKLPDKLVYLNIKNNKLTSLDNLSFGLKILIISDNKIDKIYSLNAGIEQITINDMNLITKINIYDLPNMLIILLGGGNLNDKLRIIYNQICYNNFSNFV